MKFTVKQFKATIGKAKGQQVYQAKAKNIRTISLEEVVADISEMSSLTTGDVRNALDRIAYYLRRELTAGNTVQLGTIGTFRMSIAGRYVQDAKQANATSLRRPRIRLIPGRSLREAVEAVRTEVDNPFISRTAEQSGTGAPANPSGGSNQPGGKPTGEEEDGF